MKLSEKVKRLVIYLFYDKDGIVDSYIPYILKDIKKNASSIFFVSNGKVTKDGKESLNGIVDTIFERKNIGFDVWGYKEAIEEIGWEKLYKYDEVIFMNYTIMGPIYPFKEMFDEMGNKDLDFWGLTRFPKLKYDPFGIIECGFLPEHIQSHFIAVRKKMLTSKQFKEYWEKMPMINNYNESIAFHESKFTYTFENLGYKWDVYVKSKDLDDFTNCPILYCPTKIIKERKCPIFKRRSFFHDYTDVLYNTCGEHSRELMEYLSLNTDYDVNMIWENILRCYDMSSIKDVLQLNFVLPTKGYIGDLESKNKPKVALIFHAYFPDLIDETEKSINSMPKYADVYITTDTIEKKKLFEEKFKNNKFNKLEVLQIENRGRDVSALLVASKDFVMDYDYVCFAHDKKVNQIPIGSIGNSFAYNCFINLLPSEDFVLNVIDTFNKNPRLGLLTPMMPIHSSYFSCIGNEWGPNFEITKRLADKLELNVPINEDHAPIAPLGTMFWFRPKGMKKLFDYNWKYDDFPKEPNKIDGTLLHAIERCYGFVEQDAGYYSGWLFSDIGSAISITNLSYMLGNINHSFIKNNVTGIYFDVLKQIDNKFRAVNHLEEAGKYFSLAYPELFKTNTSFACKLYVDNGNGFNENDVLLGEYSIKDNKLKCKIENLDKFKTIKNLRLDPGEDGYLVINNLELTIIGKDEKYNILNRDIYINGIKNNSKLVFTSNDPMLIWNMENKPQAKAIEILCDIKFGIGNEDIKLENTDYDIESLLCRLYVDKGNGFKEENVIVKNCEIKDNYIDIAINGLEKYKTIKNLRLDPGEDGNLTLEKLDVSVITANGKFNINPKKICTNGIKEGKKISFECEDPMLIWNMEDILNAKGIELKAIIKLGVEKNIIKNMLRKIKRIIKRG